MNKTILKNTLIAAITVLSCATTFSFVVSAQSVRAEEAQTTEQTRREAAQSVVSEKKEAAQTRLADAKLKLCQNREKAVTHIMARMSDRGQKQINLFTKIADRTQAFYVKKGKILSNYDALVSDVAAKKAAAQAAVDSTKASAPAFKCDGTDPKGAAASFKENMKAQNEALKGYKTAVKDLIVGVKSVQGSTTSTEKNTGGEQ